MRHCWRRAELRHTTEPVPDRAGVGHDSGIGTDLWNVGPKEDMMVDAGDVGSVGGKAGPDPDREAGASEVEDIGNDVIVVYRETQREGPGRGDWRWKRMAGNGRALANGGEGYHNKADCITALDRVNNRPYSIVVSGGPPVAVMGGAGGVIDLMKADAGERHEVNVAGMAVEDTITANNRLSDESDARADRKALVEEGRSDGAQRSESSAGPAGAGDKIEGPQ